MISISLYPIRVPLLNLSASNLKTLALVGSKLMVCQIGLLTIFENSPETSFVPIVTRRTETDIASFDDFGHFALDRNIGVSGKNESRILKIILAETKGAAQRVFGEDTTAVEVIEPIVAVVPSSHIAIVLQCMTYYLV